MPHDHVVRRMDGQTDGGDNNIPDAFSKKCGDKNKKMEGCLLQILLGTLRITPVIL